MTQKEKKKFDIALINSRVVYWYMQNLDGTFDKYLDRINDYLQWMSNRPSEKVAYNAMKVVKDFIVKYDLSDDFLRNYCHTLEHNNPRENWRKNEAINNSIVENISMTQEQKELLLKDLCARLPYNPIVEYKGEAYNVLGIAHGRLVLCKPFMSYTLDENPLIEEVKPYLFPFSRMTEEIMDEIYNSTGVYDIDVLSPVHIEVGTTFEDLTKITDILHKHHIDYRDLIPMGLANDIRRLNNIKL